MSNVILSILCVATTITALWLVIRIWQSSPVGAIATFLLGFPAWYYLFKYWGDEEKDIRVPFFISLGLLIISFVTLLNSGVVQRGEDEGTAKAEVARNRSNPEMERWCREKNDAVYDYALGTCVEPEPGQEVADSRQARDVMDLLENHFSTNGLTVSVFQVDDSMPGARKLSSVPEIIRLMKFEIQSKSALPTIIMVGECVSVEKCHRIEKGLAQSDAPFSIASNGNLIFMGIRMTDDAGNIERAKKVFQSFKAQT